MLRVRRALTVDRAGTYHAKTNLSALVERAAPGEEIVIAKSGKPKALLVPLPDARPLAANAFGDRVRVLTA
jgi:prevent-host-death family protein